MMHRLGPHKRGSLRFLSSLLSLAIVVHTLTTTAYAMPQGGRVAGGEGAIQTDTDAMTVEQTSDRLAIHWDSFDISADETVTFNQPSPSSIALNRVITLDPSEISGQLQANGQVFLINPNGIIFGDGASVNTAGFVASTLNLDDDDFINGTYRFRGTGTAGRILNRGVLSAAGGGYVALISNSVENSGEIHAPSGEVALAAGDGVTLYLDGSGLFKAEVDAAAVGAEIHNGGLIAAEGGQVVLTARAKDALLDTVINHTGLTDVSSMEARGGVIVLSGGADGGTVQVNGRLDASAPQSEGGEIRVIGHAVHVGSDAELDASGDSAGGLVETSGEVVRVDEGAQVSTRATAGAFGTWLIDPNDYMIGPVDPADGSSYMSHITLSSNLESGNVEIATTDGVGGSGFGNITVDGAVSWDAATTLTLKAHNRITLNESISATSAESALTLLAGGHDFGGSEQTGDVTLDVGKEIEVGTLTIGGNPDVFTGTFGSPSSIGDVNLHGELHVSTLNIERTKAGFGSVAATNANNTIGRFESSGDRSFQELNVRDASGGLDVFLDYEEMAPEGGDIVIRTQGDFTLLANSKISFHPNPINVVLVSDGGAFINQAGADAIVVDAAEHQRFLIYSSDPDTTLTGGLAGLAVYGKTFATYDEDYGTGFDAERDGVSRFIYAPGDQPELILIAKDLERFYGDPNPTFDEGTWEVQGLADGETLSDVLFGGDPTLSTAATQHSPANTSDGYPITITGPGLSSNKYELRFQNGILRVKPAPVTLDIGDTTREYGETVWDGPPTVTATEGLKLGHAVDDLGITYTYNQDPTQPVVSLSTPISVAFGNSNYTWANPFQTGDLTIRKADLTGQINTVTREYGSSISSGSVLANDITWAGFKNADDWRVVAATLNDESPETDVGTYTLSGTGAATNYNVTILDGVLEIVPAPLDIRIHDDERVYGDANPTFSAEATGLRNDDAFADIFSGVYATGATMGTDIGDYDIVLESYTISGNYSLNGVENGTLTITPATLTGDIGLVQRVYGDVLTPSDVDDVTQNMITWSGFKNGDGPSVVDVTLDDQPVTADVGTYTLEGKGTAANYVVTLTPGDLEITRAPLIGQIGNAQRTYGETLSLSALQNAIRAITWSGFKNGDGASLVNVTLNDQPITTDVGDYAFTGSAMSKNYSVDLADGVLTIRPAELSLSAINVTRDRDEPNPTSWMTVKGTKFDEPLESLIRYNAYIGVDSDTPPGSYFISIKVPGDPNLAVGHVSINVEEVLSPNYVLGNVRGGTLTIRNFVRGTVIGGGSLTLSGELDLSKVREQFEENLAKQREAEERANHPIVIGSRPTLSGFHVDDMLANDPESIKNMIQDILSEGVPPPELRSFLEDLRSGEVSFESWRQEIDEGTTVARRALALVLPRYANQLLTKDKDALTTTERSLLRVIGHRIDERRQTIADRAKQLLQEYQETNVGLTSAFALHIPDVVAAASEEMAEESTAALEGLLGSAAIGLGGGAAAGAAIGLLSSLIMPYASVGLPALAQGASMSMTAAVSAGPAAIIAMAIVVSIQAGFIATEAQSNLDSYRRIQELASENVNSAYDLTSGGLSDGESIEVSMAVIDLLSDGNW